jgi:uncharacterized membrane protein YgcG
VLGHAVWFMGKLKHITRSLQKAHKKKSKDKLLYLKSQLTELNKILPKNGIRLPLITCASNVSHGTSNSNASVRGSGGGGGGGGSGVLGRSTRTEVPISTDINLLPMCALYSI